MGLRVDPNARFERQRQKAKQEETSRQQLAREAIARKFAAQGLQGSGADIKITRQAQEEGAKRLDQRLGDIASAQETEALRRQEIEAAREFQRGERKASQAFAAEQSRLGREQQASQFAEQMGFTREQFEAGREQFQKQFDQQVKQFNWQKGLSEEQLQLSRDAADLALEQFDFQKRTEAFNAAQSIINQFLPPGGTIKEGQIEALIGIMGPEIIGQMPNLQQLITGTAPSVGGGSANAAPAGGGINVQRSGSGVGTSFTVNGRPARRLGNNKLIDDQGYQYINRNGTWERL